jgi:hypothetical protein
MSNIKKKIVAVVTGLTLVVMMAPGLAQGATVEELQAQINALLAQLATLQSQLAALQGTTPTVTGCTITSFARNLKQGMTGDDVKCLQIVLNSDAATQVAATGAGSPGNETSYFGSLTKAAVVKFQEKYAADVLTPIGLTAGTGFVGAKTLAKLNSILTAGAPAAEVPAEEVPAAAPGLTVALASDTPAAAVVSNSTAYNSVLKVDLSAGSEGDVSITGLTVTKSGLTANTSIAGVAVFDAAGNRHGNFVTSLTADNTANLVFTTDPIVVAKGTKTSITIKVNTSSTATSGTMQFSIAKAADITSDASAINGTFPITGNVFSLTTGANLAAVTVTLQTLGTSTADVGATGHLVTKFRFTETTGNEDVKLSQLVLYNNGSANDTDYGNLVLVDQTGATVATATAAVSKYVTFNISPAYTIPRGTSRDLSVKTDILGGSNNTIDLRIMEAYDIVLTGATSGYGILTSSTLPTAADTNKVTISQGVVTAAKAIDSRAGKIPQGGKDIKLAKFDVKAFGEDFELRSFYYCIQKASGGTALAGTLKVLDSAGTILYSVAGSSATYKTSAPSAEADWTKITLSTYKTIKAGTTETLTFVGDVSSSATTTDTYQVYATKFYGKRMSTKDYYTASDTWTGSSAAYGNTLTVENVILRLAKNDAFANPTIVGGAKGVKIGSYVLQATAVEDVNITSMKITLQSGMTGYTNVQLKTGTTNLGSPIASPTLATGDTVSMALTIPAGGQKVIDVYADTVSTSATSKYTQLGTIAATGASSGAPVTSPSTVTGQTVSITTGGTLTIEADPTNTPAKAILTAASLSQQVFKFKVTANAIEDITLDKLYVGVKELTGATTPTASSGNVTNVTLKKADGTVIGGPADPVNGQVGFAGLNLVVSKGTSVQLTVELDVSGLVSPGAKVYVAPIYAEYTRIAGVVVNSGGVYDSYAADTNLITVYNIGQFEAGDAIRIDANGDGDFADTSVNGINETTTYYACNLDTTNSQLKLNTASNCGTETVVDITGDANLDGWIAPVAVVSNRMLLHDVEPVITLNAGSLSGTQSPQSGQDIAKFDVKANGVRPLIVNAISWVTSGDYVGAASHTANSATCTTSGFITVTAKTGFADTYTVNVATGDSATDTVTVKSGTLTLETFTNVNTTSKTAIIALSSKYVTITDGSTTCAGGVPAGDITLVAGSTNGGIYDWNVQINDVNQLGTLYASQAPTTDDTFYKVNAATLRTNTGTYLTFVFTTPVEISAGSTVTFEINANTSAVKAGVTSGTKTAGVYIDGTKGEGEWLGGGADRVEAATLGGLRWDYLNLLGNYGATGTSTAGTMTTTTVGAATAIDSSAATSLDVSDSYRINGNTITY